MAPTTCRLLSSILLSIKTTSSHAEHAAELEKKLMKHAGQLNLMRSFTLNEWAKTNIDTEDRFKGMLLRIVRVQPSCLTVRYYIRRLGMSGL